MNFELLVLKQNNPLFIDQNKTPQSLIKAKFVLYWRKEKKKRNIYMKYKKQSRQKAYTDLLYRIKL